MLSTRFQKVVENALDMRAAAESLDVSLRAQGKSRSWINCGIASTILDPLRELNMSALIEDPDKCTYNNYVYNAALNTIIRTRADLATHTNAIGELRRIDYMSDPNKQTISSCLDAMNIDFKINEDMYHLIRTSIGASHSNEPGVKLLNLLLKAHLSSAMQKIYYVWKMDDALYLPDMLQFMRIIEPCRKLTPHDEFHSFSFYYPLDHPKVTYELIRAIFECVESLVVKYRDISMFAPLVKPVAPLESKNAPPVNAKSMTVPGLKELCEKHNILVPAKAKRCDYETKLREAGLVL